MLKVIKRITGLPFRFGGEEHEGWLPPGAAKPPPTPAEDVILDLEITHDGHGYLLCWRLRDGKQHGDLWTPAPLLKRLAESGKTFADLDKESSSS